MDTCRYTPEEVSEFILKKYLKEHPFSVVMQSILHSDFTIEESSYVFYLSYGVEEKKIQLRKYTISKKYIFNEKIQSEFLFYKTNNTLSEEIICENGETIFVQDDGERILQELKRQYQNGEVEEEVFHFYEKILQQQRMHQVFSKKLGVSK